MLSTLYPSGYLLAKLRLLKNPQENEDNKKQVNHGGIWP